MKTRALDARAAAIFREDMSAITLRTDQMFFWLLLAQWAAAIVVALVWSPRTWIAQYWSLHQHVLAAALLGGLFAAYPLYLIRRQPGTRYTRQIIAVGQMLQSALLVHVTGGRIETHFHVFGSLALLAFYRDWRVLITASLVVYIDHLALGIWFPLSVYGELSANIWRSVEHAFWVIFEVVFLAMSCRKGIEELSAIAEREVRLQDAASKLRESNEEILQMSQALQETNRSLESRVAQRTQELSHAKENLEDQVKERTRELLAVKDNLEVQVQHRTQDLELAKQQLQRHVQELKSFNKIMMGREQRVLQLKKEIKALEARLSGVPASGADPSAEQGVESKMRVAPPG